MIGRIFCAVWLALVPIAANAQYYETGVEPFGTKWKKISAKNISVIFPADAQNFASQYLNSLVIADSLAGADYGLPSRPIEVVLHNHNAQPNGLVSWAPRRMELITFPLDMNSPELWHNHLAIHETRHVKQMRRLNTNFIRGLSYIIGEQSVGIAAAQVPQWFLEGDAVFAETKYSNSGRGRNASFYQLYRAHYLTRDSYFKFDKWLNGSYRDHIPNQYALGFQLVDFADNKFGPGTWNSVMRFVSRWPITVGPFYFGTKLATGLNPRRLSDATFSYRDSLWTAAYDSSATTGVSLSPRHTTYTSYTHPFKNSAGQIICYKTSLKCLPAFVSISCDGSERTILCAGLLVGNPYIDDSLIVWSEFKAHIRWEQVSYGRVVKYNYLTHKKTVFPQRGIFFAPVYCPAKSSLLALHYASDGVFTVQQLHKDGQSQVLHTFGAGVNPQEMVADDRYLYIAAVTAHGKQVLQIGFDEPARVVLPPIFADFESICVSRGNIYFSATDGYTKNIFCHNFVLNKTYRVVNSAFGSNYPSVCADDELIYSNFSEKGDYVASSKITTGNAVNLLDIGAAVSASIEAEANKISGANSTQETYHAQHYSELRHLLNVHSWAPLFLKPFELASGDISVKPGATVMSQNLTGTTIMSVGYGYDHFAQHHNLFNATVQYTGWWPTFLASFDLEPQNAHLYRSDNSGFLPLVQRKVFRLNIALPLSLTSNSIVTYVLPFSNLVYDNGYLFSKNLGEYRSGVFTINNGVYFSLLSRKAHRDLRPRLGTTLKIDHALAPASRNNLGSLVAAVSRLYLPGIASNHSVLFKASYQHQHLKNFYLANKVQFPRGCDEEPSESFWGFEANYAFPLCYPDFNIGMLTYIKRFSLNLFFDCARNTQLRYRNGNPFRQNSNLSSSGFELSTDFHLFRLRFPFLVTYRLAWPRSGESPQSWIGLNIEIN